MCTRVPNHAPIHGGSVSFWPFPPIFVRKPLFRHISTMGTPCHQLQKIKTHSNQGFISQCAQGCQIMPQSMVVWSVFGHSPLFSSENPSFDTSTPWGHHATNSKKSKPIATKVSYHNVHKGAKSCPNPWWFGQFLAIPPSFRPRKPLFRHMYTMGTPFFEVPNFKWTEIWHKGASTCG